MRLATLVLLLVFSACASKDAPPPKEEGLMVNGERVTRYSEQDQLPNVSQRNYKRMTRQKLEEESELHAQAGSMWVMEGQGAYLFTQNKSRKEGDLLNVRIEGAAQKQIETKVAVIKKLLKQLEEEESRQRAKEQEKEEDDKKPEEQKLADAKNKDARAPASAPKAEPAAEKEEPLAIESVPTKIVERQPDGNYKVKGQLPFMIGKREYKVIVTGAVRPEDFNDEGISSSRLLEPQFDVMSIRRKVQ